jgi:hypothetical protein
MCHVTTKLTGLNDCQLSTEAFEYSSPFHVLHVLPYTIRPVDKTQLKCRKGRKTSRQDLSPLLFLRAFSPSFSCLDVKPVAAEPFRDSRVSPDRPTTYQPVRCPSSLSPGLKQITFFSFVSPRLVSSSTVQSSLVLTFPSFPSVPRATRVRNPPFLFPSFLVGAPSLSLRYRDPPWSIIN